MLHLGSTYLIVKYMDKSIDFYEKLLDMKPTVKIFDRWAQFNFGDQCIALYNNEYDIEMLKANKDLNLHYNDWYTQYIKTRNIAYGNNFVLNFWIEDLKAEYKRIKSLKIGAVSEIMYINIAIPYYFFTVIDPDGNTIEITGGYENN